MKKKLLFAAILIIVLSFSLFGCSAERPGEQFVALLNEDGTQTIGFRLKRFVGVSTQPEYTVPDEHEGWPVVEIGKSDGFGIEAGISNNEYLKTVNIGKNILSIDIWSFTNMKMLENINVSPENPNFCSVDGVLFTKDMTELRVFPNKNKTNYVVPDSVKVIGVNAFYRCKAVESVTLPEGLTTIRERGFWFATMLAPPVLPSTLTTIEKDAFNGFATEHYDKVQKGKAKSSDPEIPVVLYIPASVTTVGDYAISRTGLTQIAFRGAAGSVTLGKGWNDKNTSTTSASWGVSV